MKHIYFAGIGAVLTLLQGCTDDNAQAVYGKETGLPVNCRAYIQYAINEHRAGKYSAEETLVGIERNCGQNGGIWKDNR
jgi:hypothetical protein